MINRSGRSERGEAVVEFLVVGFAADAVGGAEPGEFEVGERGAVDFETTNLGVGVLHVFRDENATDVRHAIEGFGGLRDDRFPVGGFGIGEIDRDEFLSGGIAIGLDEKFGVDVSGEAIRGVEFVEELNDFGVGLGEVFVEKAVLGIGTLRDVDDEEAFVIGQPGVEAPLGVIRTFVDEGVFGLRGAELVVVDFLVGVGGCSSEGESLLLILESVMSSLDLFFCAATTGLCSLHLSSCN